MRMNQAVARLATPEGTNKPSQTLDPINSRDSSPDSLNSGPRLWNLVALLRQLATCQRRHNRDVYVYVYRMLLNQLLDVGRTRWWRSRVDAHPAVR